MIDPISAAGVSSGAGAIVGLVCKLWQGAREAKVDLARAKAEEEAARSGCIKEYRESLRTETKGAAYENSYLWGAFKSKGVRPPRAFTPAFNSHIMLITATYCAAVGICFYAADIPVLHQAVDGSGTTWRVGFIERTSPDKTVYILTLGSVGAYLLSVPAFILASVFTGVTPKRLA